MPRLPLLITALSALTFATTASAEVRFGLQGARSSDFGTPFLSGGAHVSFTDTLPRTLLGSRTARTTLEANVTGGPLGPNLLVDHALLWPQASGLYYGAGFGSGVAFPGAELAQDVPYPVVVLLTPGALVNVHGVVGVTFSGVSTEALIRWRPVSDGVTAGVRVSFPLK